MSRYRVEDDRDVSLYVCVKCIYDEDGLLGSVEREFPYHAKVVVDGHVRESYHAERDEAEDAAKQWVAVLMLKRDLDAVSK